MADKPIQEQFGTVIIDAVREFANADIDNVPEIEKNFFSHVGDRKLRQTLAETFYGARWIYKLGLALLVKDEEQMAHVRCQVIDYGSCCEGLLHEAIRHAIVGNSMIGKKYKYSDTNNLRNPIDFSKNVNAKLKKMNFYWHIEVANDERIIDSALSKRLHDLRKARNTVHIQSRTYKAFLNTSRDAYQTFLDAVNQTRAWRCKHP